jgi:hypothetical protein
MKARRRIAGSRIIATFLQTELSNHDETCSCEETSIALYDAPTPEASDYRSRTGL